jgi:hypothetical protein
MQEERGGTSPWREWATLAAMLLCFAHLCYLGLQKKALQRGLITGEGLGSIDHMIAYHRSLDAMAARVSKKDNVLIDFSAYSNATKADTNTALQIYYRFCYAAYPKRFYATFEDGLEPLRQGHPADFHPSPEWLAQHGVALRMAVEPAAGRPHITLNPVP